MSSRAIRRRARSSVYLLYPKKVQILTPESQTGVLEMQSAARSATEARKELEAERQRRNEERTQLTGQLEQVRQEVLSLLVLLVQKYKV
jgi:hypothetical protein